MTTMLLLLLFFIYKKSISHANVACMVISSCAAPEGWYGICYAAIRKAIAILSHYFEKKKYIYSTTKNSILKINLHRL